MAKLSVADYRTFLDDTAAKGFNAVEFEAIYNDSGLRQPALSGNGPAPFTKRRSTGDLDRVPFPISNHQQRGAGVHFAERELIGRISTASWPTRLEGVLCFLVSGPYVGTTGISTTALACR